VKGQSNKWPCTIDRPGSVYWYCEDGPGWKPPRELRDRAALEEKEEEAARRARTNYKTGEGAAVWVPQLSDNIFQMLWTAVPVAKGAAKGTVELDLTVLGERTNVHSVRYAWPLGDDGDTCCPGADVAAGFTVCTPANCPILSERSQLPAVSPPVPSNMCNTDHPPPPPAAPPPHPHPPHPPPAETHVATTQQYGAVLTMQVGFLAGPVGPMLSAPLTF